MSATPDQGRLPDPPAARNRPTLVDPEQGEGQEIDDEPVPTARTADNLMKDLSRARVPACLLDEGGVFLADAHARRS
jgi:hypothetical protein